MAIENNARRIIKTYHGDTKIWEDPHFGEWQDIKWAGNTRSDKTQYMAVNGVICFMGDVGGTCTATIPEVYKNLILITPGQSSDGNGNFSGITLNGHVLRVVNGFSFTSTSSIMLSYTK